MHATQLWSHWQELLAPCAGAFTPEGFRRFTEWLTGLALNVEEHTITQSLVGLNRPADWKDWRPSPSTATGTNPPWSAPPPA
jgi:hypothetical protein